MNVRARFVGQPSRWVPVGCMALLIVATILNMVVLSLVAFAIWTAAWARHVRVTIHGGGYRPIRESDFIDEVAVDSLDAYDQEQAAAEAQRRARAEQNAPRW